MSLSKGPTLFLAPGPTSWQARHFLKTSAPSSALPSWAAADWACSTTADAASINASVMVWDAARVISTPFAACPGQDQNRLRTEALHANSTWRPKRESCSTYRLEGKTHVL